MTKISDHMPVEMWAGIRLHRVTWVDVLYEYRLWAEWYFRPSKCLLGTEPDDAQQQRARETWWRFVLYQRQQQEAKNAA